MFHLYALQSLCLIDFYNQREFFEGCSVFKLKKFNYKINAKLL